ncbi:LAFA_0G08614g1_1 [Lachancea sp. 'fantastica']|nr:LAFA_0G08614g1_1 [Lachancea sp. 'fantastica']
MSFYQPSLSLYDILDALANQAAVRNQRERPDVRRGTHPRSHHGHHGSGRHRAAMASPYGQTYGQTYGQSPYYYVESPQTSYYRPSYYEEDESEAPYYWNGLNAQQEAQQQAQLDAQQPPFGFLPEILRAFAGASGAEEPSEGTAPTAADQASAAEEEVRRAIEKNSGEDNAAPTASQSNAEAQDNLSVPAEEEVKDTARSEAPSPVPEPLQVSKPQVRRNAPFSPQVNVYDEADAYAVVMALPGASSKSFKIDYHPSSHELLIKGSLDKKFGFDDKNVRVSELHTGKFERSVKFPVIPRIKDEEIKATYCNGLLVIKTPKILDDALQPPPRRHIVIEDVPDEELEFEKNPNPPTAL